MTEVTPPLENTRFSPFFDFTVLRPPGNTWGTRSTSRLRRNPIKISIASEASFALRVLCLFCTKSKKKVNNDPSEWVVFENTHEAIIDQKTFEIVQNIRNGRRRLTPMGEMPVLSGMLFCADCGAKLYQVRARGWTHEQEHFVCATYRKQKGKCTSHQIRNVQVEQILLVEINRMLAFVRERESEFAELLAKKNERDLNRQFRECSRELEQATQRITKLDSII